MKRAQNAPVYGWYLVDTQKIKLHLTEDGRLLISATLEKLLPNEAK